LCSGEVSDREGKAKTGGRSVEKRPTTKEQKKDEPGLMDVVRKDDE
jgi:hypothetical protein